MSDFSNALIYGKNTTERIISCEVHDGYVRLFKLDSELNTCVEDIPNRPWILGHKYMGPLGTQLHGNQYYKYGRQFRTIEEWDTARRMCKRFDQFTVHNLKENAMLNKGFTYFKGLTPNEIPILSFDIETVGLELSSKSKVLLISNTFRRGTYVEKRLFAYDEFASDGEMIDEWCKWVREKDPAILLAHNGFTFDLPYLICCAKINGTSLKLGRDGSDIYINDYESQYRIDGSNSLSYAKLFVYGREIVDTLFLAYKYDTATKKYENYKLKYIIEKEGLEKKDRTFYDASQIRYNYTNPEEFSKIKAYCCFAPKSSLISLDDSSVKYIEDIKVGDKVIDGLGNIEYVYDKIERDYNGELFSFDVEGGRKIHSVTPEHPFLTLNEKTLKYEFKKAKNLQQNDLLVIGGKNKEDTSIYGGVLKSDKLWLFGFLQGDGYVRVQKNTAYPVLTCHEDELDRIISKLDNMKLKYSIIHFKTRVTKAKQIVITDNKLGQLFLNWAGGKFAGPDKKCSESFFRIINNSKRNFLCFLGGILDADGHFRRLKEKTYQMNMCLVSPHLINIIDLCCSTHSINLTRQNFRTRGKIGDKLPNNRFLKTCNLFYELVFFTDSMKLINNYLFLKKRTELIGQYSTFTHKKHCRITKKYQSDYIGKVYNISVTNSHSYISNGLISHNCDDSDDSLALFDLMVPPFFYMGQMIPKSFQEMICSATGSQINALMIRGYLQDKHSIAKADERCGYEGAISFGIPGIYRNVVKIDVASLYPSVQLQYEIYPKKKDEKGNLLLFLKLMRDMRLYHKKKGKETGLAYHKHMDTSQKFLINSLYGFMGASGLNYNYPEGAAEITRRGREIISKTIEWASGKSADYWINKNGETDDNES